MPAAGIAVLGIAAQEKAAAVRPSTAAAERVKKVRRSTAGTPSSEKIHAAPQRDDKQDYSSALGRPLSAIEPDNSPATIPGQRGGKRSRAWASIASRCRGGNEGQALAPLFLRDSSMVRGGASHAPAAPGCGLLTRSFGSARAFFWFRLSPGGLVFDTRRRWLGALSRAGLPPGSGRRDIVFREPFQVVDDALLLGPHLVVEVFLGEFVHHVIEVGAELIDDFAAVIGGRFSAGAPARPTRTPERRCTRNAQRGNRGNEQKFTTHGGPPRWHGFRSGQSPSLRRLLSGDVAVILLEQFFIARHHAFAVEGVPFPCVGWGRWPQTSNFRSATVLLFLSSEPLPAAPAAPLPPPLSSFLASPLPLPSPSSFSCHRLSWRGVPRPFFSARPFVYPYRLCLLPSLLPSFFRNRILSPPSPWLDRLSFCRLRPWGRSWRRRSRSPPCWPAHTSLRRRHPPPPALPPGAATASGSPPPPPPPATSAPATAATTAGDSDRHYVR